MKIYRHVSIAMLSAGMLLGSSVVIAADAQGQAPGGGKQGTGGQQIKDAGIGPSGNTAGSETVTTPPEAKKKRNAPVLGMGPGGGKQGEGKDQIGDAKKQGVGGGSGGAASGGDAGGAGAGGSGSGSGGG